VKPGHLFLVELAGRATDTSVTESGNRKTMKSSRMLSVILSVTLFVLGYFAFEQATVAQGEPNLTCPDLANCGGTASCNSAGTVNGCVISCYGGGEITCKKKSEGEGEND